MRHKDKLLHFSICFVASILSPMLGLGLALGKEYGDSKATGRHWCWLDIAADAAGIALAVVIRYFIF